MADNINMGSKKGFILGLTGGILFLLIGLGFFVFIMFKLYTFDWIGGNPDNRLKYLVLIFIGLYLSIVNIWIVTASFWVRRHEKLRAGGWTLWVLGLISFNVLASVAGVLAILQYKRESGDDREAIMNVKTKL